MKVLLLKDVYKLGRAGEVKRVADGYGRNYLLPQGLATLATPGALRQAERIQKDASAQRQVLNEEMSGVADRLKDVILTFPARASETGKLYGSVTTQMIAEALSERVGVEIARRQIDSQPLRALGEHKVHVRLTVDLVPELTVIVHREGEMELSNVVRGPSAARDEVELSSAARGEAPAAGQEPAEEVPPSEPEVEDTPEPEVVEETEPTQSEETETVVE